MDRLVRGRAATPAEQAGGRSKREGSLNAALDLAMAKKTTKSNDGKKPPRVRSKATRRGRKRRFPRWRKWVARLLAVVLAPTLFLTTVELGLRLFGYGFDASYFIPAQDGDTYLSNPKCTWHFFGPELSRTPIQTILSADKPENTYRVFVFGGSAAQGIPDPAFSFSRILEAMLGDRYPETRFEVINTAMVAINSHVVLPIVKQCGGFDGDLYIVYLGNNEVVGPYGAGTVFQSPCSSVSLILRGDLRALHPAGAVARQHDSLNRRRKCQGAEGMGRHANVPRPPRDGGRSADGRCLRQLHR